MLARVLTNTLAISKWNMNANLRSWGPIFEKSYDKFTIVKSS